jgi:hypothetical protein
LANWIFSRITRFSVPSDGKSRDFDFDRARDDVIKPGRFKKSGELLKTGVVMAGRQGHSDTHRFDCIAERLLCIGPAKEIPNVRAERSPGFISATALAGSGMKVMANAMAATSNSSSEYGRDWASPTRNVAPAAAALLRA